MQSSSVLRWNPAMGCHPLLLGWLDGVGRAGTYGTAERMNGRTRLHRCREGIPINNCARIEGILVRINTRRQDTKCVIISWMGGLGRMTKRWGGNTSQTVKSLVHEWQATVSSTIRESLPAKLRNERTDRCRWFVVSFNKTSSPTLHIFQLFTITNKVGIPGSCCIF